MTELILFKCNAYDIELVCVPILQMLSTSIRLLRKVLLEVYLQLMREIYNVFSDVSVQRGYATYKRTSRFDIVFKQKSKYRN